MRSVTDAKKGDPSPTRTATDIFRDRCFFRREEFVADYLAAGHSSGAAREALHYYVGTGVLLNIRRGVYMVAGATFDPYLLPSKLHPLAVIAYDGAAAFHGLAELQHSLCFLVPGAMRVYRISETLYRAIADPSVAKPDPKHPTIHAYPHGKQKVAVTSVERTLADCLDRLDLGPDATELGLRFFRQRERRLDLQRLLAYATERCGGLGCARLGLILSGHPAYRHAREALNVLAEKVPRRSAYAAKNREPGGVYYARWRLTVPRALADHIPLD